MNRGARTIERLLLIDTCGETAVVALAGADGVLRSKTLVGRTASAHLLRAVKDLLNDEGWTIADLHGVGVVAGPGSFTGMRTGLAFAKGLCEIAKLPLASVSRLAVLAEAAGLQEGFAVLSAGRGELYVRGQRRTESPREWMTSLDEFKKTAAGSPIVVADEKTAELLDALSPRLYILSAAELTDPVRRCFENNGTDLARADSNYVSIDSETYSRPQQEAVSD